MSDSRPFDGQATDSRPFEGQATDGRAADGRATDGRAIDRQASDERASDGRATGVGAVDRQASDGRATDGRAIGLDLGERRIGVAVCDADRTVATPSETVKRLGDRPAEHDAIAEIVVRTGATVVVVGLPLSLDGSVGPAARKVLSEVAALRRRLGPDGIDVVTHDERHSTTTATHSLSGAGVDSRRGRAVVDQVAAAVILQSWIDATTS